MKQLNKADVAIVGGGILGLAFALEARQQKKLLYLKEIRRLEEPLFEILGWSTPQALEQEIF